MPSQYLRERHRKLLSESSGTDTVDYYEFGLSVPGAKNSFTGDIDESKAYSSEPISLPARIDNFPTRAIRALAGEDISFQSMLRLAYDDLNDNGITLKTGDAFVLPGETVKKYVVKVVPRKQSDNLFLEYLAFVSTKRGHRG